VDVNILLTTVKSTPLVHRSRDIFGQFLCSNTSGQQFLTWTSKMATLVNTHEHREPTIPTMPKLTTGSLGLLTRAINMSRTVNSTDLGPDEFNNMSFDNNMDTWWLALPTALYSAIKAGDRVANNPERQHDVSSLGRTHHESNTVHSNLQHVLPCHRVAH
jgi:hypothetical protein